MTGFKAETESGVRSAFSGLAKIAGIALGAGAAFDLAKNAVEAAAGIQKQTEVIRAEFGAAGQSVVRFADTTGTSLGAANTATDALSARLGILFHNLGIGEGQAAQMTKRWEELGLAFNAARGGGVQGAADVLQRLQIAATGASTRGLRQLGISIDANQQKVAAFKLGLTQTITQALTPAQKAVTTYALAMAHLPSLLALARAHSGDFANVQARLSAEWEKAKEILGKALLPEVNRIVTALSHWLSAMERNGRLQKDFNTAGRVASDVLKGIVSVVKVGVGAWDALSKALGGAKQVAIAFFAVVAVNKIRQIAGTIISSLVNNGFAQLKIATQAEKTAYIEAFGTMEVATVGLGATIKSALVTTGIGALVVAIGIATGWVITHWGTVKRVTVALAEGIAAIWGGLKTTLIGIAELIGGGMATWLLLPLRLLVAGVQGISSLLDSVGVHILDFSNRIGGMLDSVSTGLFRKGLHNIAQGGATMASAFGAAFTKAMQTTPNDPTQKAGRHKTGAQLAKDVLDGATSALQAGIPGIGKTLSDTLRNTIAAAHQRIQQTIMEAKNNLDKIGQDLAKTISEIQQKIGGAAGAIAGSPQGQAFAKLKKLIESGAPTFEIARAQQALSSQLQNVGKTQAQNVRSQLANLTDEFNRGHIGYRGFERGLQEILHRNGITIREAMKAGGPAFADAFRAQVKALGQQARAIAAVPARLRGLGGGGGAADIKIIRPLEVIRMETQRIAVAAQKQRDAQLKAQEKANATLQEIHATQVSATGRPGYHHPAGKNSRVARRAALAGARP